MNPCPRCNVPMTEEKHACVERGIERLGFRLTEQLVPAPGVGDVP
jgi:hypothetical protein